MRSKLRLVKPGVLAHFCAGCVIEHSIDIHALSANGHTTGWDGDFQSPTFGESVRHNTPHGPCEYELRAGVQYFSRDCWHPLAGKSRHLEEISQ